VTDFRRFLGASTEESWPYFGGPYVETGKRRLRLTEPAEPGYWRFAVTGRSARRLGPAEPPDLRHLPAVRGHALPASTAGVYVTGPGGGAERLAIAAPDEPLLFAPVVARRWPSGALLFDAWDFEDGVEDEARRAYEERGTLATVKGASAALRAAFGYAVFLRTAEDEGVPVRPAEARPHLAALADEGEAAARRLLGRLRAEREAEVRLVLGPALPGLRSVRSEATEATREGEASQARGPARAERAQTEGRAADALYAARAGVRGMRWLAGDLLEVRYDLEGERFVSIVEGATLRVVDAGICLAGRDRDLTLESLPSAIREALGTGQLNITAW
jgi:hypothetical protein